MITLFVILCFDQILSGYAVIGPRLFDTVMGVAISFLVLRFVLPDWKVRRLKERMAGVLAADARYLICIAGQYRDGRADDLAYRIARRDAHNAHAAFDGVIRDILSEPRHTATKTEAGLHALVFAHDLLSYLSALGAHRQGGTLGAGDALLNYSESVAANLERLAECFRRERFVLQDPVARNVPHTAETDDLHRLVALQLNRIEGICERLVVLGPRLAHD